MQKRWFDCDRTRTCNPRVRRPMPYPLGHTTWYEFSFSSEDFMLCSGMVKWIKKCILHLYFTIVAASRQVTQSMKLISCHILKSYCYVMTQPINWVHTWQKWFNQAKNSISITFVTDSFRWLIFLTLQTYPLLWPSCASTAK